MNIGFRRYRHPEDFGAVGDFLIEHYQSGNQDGNWLQPAWEYMHSHPNLDEDALDKIGIWEDGGQIVGVVHYEVSLGDAFFEIHPDYAGLKRIMLDYAEKNLCGRTDDGRAFLRVFVNDFDGIFEEQVKARGYQNERGSARSLFMLETSKLPSIELLPAGFTLKSLAEHNDLKKIHRLLWRGFNHSGDPPPEGIEWRNKMQSGPSFMQELAIVVESSQKEFVAFSGTRYEPTNGIAYIEPVVTDPDYRRMGLGQAAVQEGIRRCGQLGANVAYVGSDSAFYRSLGFERRFNCNCWINHWDH